MGIRPGSRIVMKGPNGDESMAIPLRTTDVLLIIDMQNDFLPGGALPVKNGDAILPGINAFARHFDHVVLTQDWHPPGHISFASAHPHKLPFVDTAETSYGTQTLWPDHCLPGSYGAELAAELHVAHAELILRKGFRRDIDSYSAFRENDKKTPTGLAGYLRERGLSRLFFCGLAYDFCVGFSALDATHFGFEAVVIEDLSRAVDLPAKSGNPGSVEHAEICFQASGVRRLGSAEIVTGERARR